MNKYQQTMENVEMSDEMKNRILDSVNEEFSQKQKAISFFAWSRFGKFIPLVACVVIIAIPVLHFLNSGNKKPAMFEASLVDEFVNAAKTYKDDVAITQVTGLEMYSNLHGYTSSDSANNTETFSIVSNVAQEYGYSANGNVWERVLCDGDKVMRFANIRTMESFLGIDMPNVNFLASSLMPGNSVFQLNGVASEYYEQEKDTVVLSAASSQCVNLSEMSSNDKAVVIKTAVGDVSVADDGSKYFAAWWEKDNMVYWLYSKKKYSTEWLLNLLGKPSD